MTRFAFIAALTLFAAACGGGSAEDDPATTTTASPTTVQQATTTSQATTTTAAPSDDDNVDLGSLSSVCVSATEDMSEAMNAYAEGLGGLMTGTFDPESLEQVAGQLEAAAEAAPDEISDDFSVIAEQMGAFYRALADIDYEPGSAPSAEQAEQLSQLGEQIDAEALQAASENVAAWYEDNCSG